MNFLPYKFLLTCPSYDPVVLFKHSRKQKICPTFQLIFEKFSWKKQFDILDSMKYNSQ